METSSPHDHRTLGRVPPRYGRLTLGVDAWFTVGFLDFLPELGITRAKRLTPTMRTFSAILRFSVALQLGISGAAWSAEFDQRMANFSTRAQVGTDADAAFVGFAIGPGAPKTVLIRAVGPALAGFGVSGALSDPRIELFSGDRLIGENDNWSATSIGGANTFNQVGAFPLAGGSRDAATAVTLSPGTYTAIVRGVAGGTGIALVEVYDVTGEARLRNLSTRARVGTGSAMLISGLAVAPGGPARRILARAAGPALAALGVTGALADPAIAVIESDSNRQISSNDNWSSGDAPALTAAFAQAGAFPFVAGSRDSALLVDLAPGKGYSVQVSGVGNTSGVALVEVYDLTPDPLATVSVVASSSATDNRGGPPAVFRITRAGSLSQPLTVTFSLSGSAEAGRDYNAVPNSVTIPAGADSAEVTVTASSAATTAATNRDLIITITAGSGYALSADRSAVVTLFFNQPTLFLASLRTPAGASASTASGSASIQLGSDERIALVSASFSALTSPQTLAYLRLGSPGEVGVDLFKLPVGQVAGQAWVITDSGALSAGDIVKALKEGRVFLSIDTSAYPGGELRGTFAQSSARPVWAAPSAPPRLADEALAATDAARFLTQSTFGPTGAEIDALTGKRQSDLEAWIAAQIALPASLHLDATDEDFRQFTAVGETPQYSQQNRQAAWWRIALAGRDQLRQRVAFALSQIFVVSDVNGTLANNPRALAGYYDILVRGAFGNARQLLEDVTLSPVMGVYLSSLRNAKATFDTAGRQLTSPDENYAREIMQLFSVGLFELQPDGLPRLNEVGAPIPTYDNRTISEMAKIFTGLGFHSVATTPNFRGEPTNYLRPMMFYPAFHEEGEKTIITGRKIPARQTPEQDLKDTLDTLFNHPNAGPFLVRQLIQRLVTSNPSPGFVYRVAQVFANNGAGVRGDLGAVVRAILLDYEARSAALAATASYGKLKEPLLRTTAVLRAFEGGANNGRFLFANPETNLAQAALRAPTVFNFFEPDFVQPGTLAAAGLVAPEYQIVTDTTAISTPNQLWNFIYAARTGVPGTTTPVNPAEGTLGVKLDATILALARNPRALVDRINLVLAAGALPRPVTDRFVGAITAMPTSTASAYGSTDLERVRSAIYLTVTVPQGAVQK